MAYNKLAIILVAFVTMDLIAICAVLLVNIDSKKTDAPVPSVTAVVETTTAAIETTVLQSTAPESTEIETTQPETTADSIEGGYDHDAYAQRMAEIASRYGTIGASAALIKNGKVIDTFAYGSAIVNRAIMTPDTKIRTASISKIFVGIATMLSVEKGTLSLDEDIATYWGFKMGTHAPGDVITPRTLLTHTSSIQNTDDRDAMYYDGMAKRLESGEGIANFVSGDRQHYSYNNYGFDVLGMTVELANKRTLDDMLTERIYQDLDIDAAFYGGDLKDTSRIADHYYMGGTVALPASKVQTWHRKSPGYSGWGFAGGVTISARDLGKMVALLCSDGVYEGKRYLSRASVRALEYHDDIQLGDYWQCQPLRYEPEKYGQKSFYYHTGSAYGVLSMAGYSHETGKGVVVLTTGASRKAGMEVFDAIAQLLLSIEA